MEKTRLFNLLNLMVDYHRVHLYENDKIDDLEQETKKVNGTFLFATFGTSCANWCELRYNGETMIDFLEKLFACIIEQKEKEKISFWIDNENCITFKYVCLNLSKKMIMERIEYNEKKQ